MELQNTFAYSTRPPSFQTSHCIWVKATADWALHLPLLAPRFHRANFNLWALSSTVMKNVRLKENLDSLLYWNSSYLVIILVLFEGGCSVLSFCMPSHSSKSRNQTFPVKWKTWKNGNRILLLPTSRCADHRKQTVGTALLRYFVRPLLNEAF